MPGLGYVELDKLTQEQPIVSISTDESISAMLFDISHQYEAFEDYPIINQYFNNNQVHVINNMDDASDFGIIDNGFMNGVPYYHISKFYEYCGKDATLYIMFANCSRDGNPDFTPLIELQSYAEGSIFQIGIWTEWPLWVADGDDYSFSPLLASIKAQTDELCGVIGQPTESSSPVSVLLFPNTAYINGIGNDIDFKKIPYALDLEYPKISVILGQDGTEDVHAMQQNNNHLTPVGLMGFALACCSLSPAEESIAYVNNFNLNKNDTFNSPELGFGHITNDNYDYSPIEEVNRFRSNQISLKGYILPVTYKAKEAGVYFSNDQTLSERDYQTLAMNRVIHKCKRIIKSVLLPYIHSTIILDSSTGKLSSTSIATFVNSITTALDQGMINKDGLPQISGRYVNIDQDQDILSTDSVSISYTVIPVNTNSQIEVEELYQTTP